MECIMIFYHFSFFPSTPDGAFRDHILSSDLDLRFTEDGSFPRCNEAQLGLGNYNQPEHIYLYVPI